MNNIPKVEIPKNVKKIEQQIKALEYQLTIDKTDLDREIHETALMCLKHVLENHL